MLAKIYITLKSGVLDPQGKAVKHSLETLNFKEVKDVRIGKYIELKLDDMPREKAEGLVKEMCERLLANTVVESYRIEI
jgi:phosphoribosylformylglycinamidine synthase